MPRVTIVHKPDLTREHAQAIFAEHFAGKYRVDRFSGPFRDFLIEKNAFVAVAVKLEQTTNETRFVYNAFTSRWWARAMLGMLIGPILGRQLTAEVRTFIDTAPQFH